MTNRFEVFDQVDARFAKIFAAIVLMLVSGLIVADIVLSVIQGQQPPIQGAPAIAERCTVASDGTRICDISPPRPPI